MFFISSRDLAQCLARGHLCWVALSVLLIGGCADYYHPMLIQPDRSTQWPGRDLETSSLLLHTIISYRFYGIAEQEKPKPHKLIKIGFEILCHYRVAISMDFADFELRDPQGLKFPFVRGWLGPQEVQGLTLMPEDWGRCVLWFEAPADYHFKKAPHLKLYWSIRHGKDRTKLITWFRHSDHGMDPRRQNPYLEHPAPFSAWMYPTHGRGAGWYQFNYGDAFPVRN